MPRPLRIIYDGAVYYLTNQGGQDHPIFLTGEDRRYFLDLLAAVINRYQWVCHAYCLTDNHYDLIIETVHSNLSLGMRQLNGVYTQYFNRTHKKTGRLFQNRFRAILVEKA